MEPQSRLQLGLVLREQDEKCTQKYLLLAHLELVIFIFTSSFLESK